MTANSIFWFVFWAAIGGIVVLVGLCVEQLAERKWFNNIGAYRFLKCVKFIGEIAVIIGVFLEVCVSCIYAYREWKEKPANEPVTDISAVLLLEVKQTEAPDLNPRHPILGAAFGGIAMMMPLGGDEITNVFDEVRQGRFLTGVRSPAEILVADSYRRMAIQETNEQRLAYLMDFKWPEIQRFDALKSGSRHFLEHETLEDVRFLIIMVDFLPNEAALRGGLVDFQVNQQHKLFYLAMNGAVVFQSTNKDDFISYIFATDSPTNTFLKPK